MAKVRIPTPLRTLTEGQDEVAVEGKSVREILKNLDARYPGFASKVADEEGNLRRFINVFVGENDVRHLKGMETAVEPRDVLSIFPAIAGG